MPDQGGGNTSLELYTFVGLFMVYSWLWVGDEDVLKLTKSCVVGRGVKPFRMLRWRGVHVLNPVSGPAERQWE